jgi:hypothetical protein
MKRRERQISFQGRFYTFWDLLVAFSPSVVRVLLSYCQTAIFSPLVKGIPPCQAGELFRRTERCTDMRIDVSSDCLTDFCTLMMCGQADTLQISGRGLAQAVAILHEHGQLLNLLYMGRV